MKLIINKIYKKNKIIHYLIGDDFYMKKILIIMLFSVILCTGFKENIVIPNDAIRVRVIANSNSAQDQSIKLKVRNSIQKTTTELLKNTTTSAEAEGIIINNMPLIKNNIDDLLTHEDYKKGYKINFGKNYFPQKKFKKKTYKEGYYKSLLVTLGTGKGSNWWCVLFPPLCLMEVEETNSNDTKYELYVTKLLKKIF